MVVVLEDLPEQSWIAFAPRENRLFYIPYIKETPPICGILHGLVDQVSQHAPLSIARVLEFIEQPVVETGVEPEIDEQPGGRASPARVRVTRQQRRPRLRQQQPLHVGKGQPAGPADEFVVEGLVSVQDGVDAAGHLQPARQLRADDRAHQRHQRRAGGGGQR